MNRVVLLLALLWPGLSVAVDGVLEINQTCAVETGCFAGDAAGFPVTISSAGSYALTSNLSISDPSLRGIDVTVDGVSIDLNFFEIAGPVACTDSGSAIKCDPGSGRGISADASANVTVRDGRVRGFAAGGVRLGDRGLVERVTVEANGFEGIRGGTMSIVRGSTAYRNGFAGILVGFGSIVKDCTAGANGTVGITANGDGIEASGGSSVQRNTVRDNTGVGLKLGAETSYRENTITFDTISGGVNMGDNACGTITCP